MNTGVSRVPATKVQQAGLQQVGGPVAQSIHIAFRGLQLAVGLLALGWGASNIRQVPPDAQAVVLRFGQVERVQPAGLVLAWPRPIGQIVLLPATERPLGLHIATGTAFGNALIDPASRAAGDVPPPTAGAYLTGDNGVVLLDAALTYRVTDAAAYYRSAGHIEPALRRLFMASEVTVAAQRSMDDFMVIGSGTDAAQSRREAIRGALMREVDRRLHDLDTPDSSLGIDVTRVDVSALLPPAAKFAFDAVLDATQMADQGVAAARTDQARIAQAGDQERDRVLAEARANADERVNTARAQVATITALARTADPASRPSLMEQAYRERVAGILRQAGSVNTVDPRGGGRLLLPAAQP